MLSANRDASGYVDNVLIKIMNNNMTSVKDQSIPKPTNWYGKLLLVFIALLLTAIVLLEGSLIISGGTMFAGKRPTNLGVNSGKLTPCPDSPNCVCSQNQDDLHKIAPLTYAVSKPEAISKLKAVITDLPRTKIITETEDYIYAEFTTSLMKFVDDVEFYVDDANKIIHMRSASRLGQSDMGVNRNRIETIRTQFTS